MNIFSACWLQNCRAGKFLQTKVQCLLQLKSVNLFLFRIVCEIGWTYSLPVGYKIVEQVNFQHLKVQYLLHLKLPEPKYYRKMFPEFRGVFESMLLSMESLKDVPRVLR